MEDFTPEVFFVADPAVLLGALRRHPRVLKKPYENPLHRKLSSREEVFSATRD